MALTAHTDAGLLDSQSLGFERVRILLKQTIPSVLLSFLHSDLDLL